MDTMKEKISIKEIAKMTNVSVATVSRVINNNGRFSEETRQKVLKAIKDTGYQQNRLAVGLRSNRSNMIGILVPDITNEFYSSIVKKCEQALAEKGYSCIVCNTDRSPDKESNYLQSLSEHMVDGLIVISTYNSSKDYLKLNIPVVYIDRNPTTNSKIIITSDHYDGAKTATQYLIDTGFSPYIFTTKTKASATQERVKGFFDTLEKNQLDIDNRILRLNLTSNEFLRGSSDAKTFLDNIADKKIGIFAINDNVAYIALQTAQELGLKVPEKVSIIGFDDVPISRITRPQISSIHQNTDVISEQAANLMVEQLDSPNNKLNVTKIIQTNLILRGTTVQP
jgi:Transcriptional regulators